MGNGGLCIVLERDTRTVRLQCGSSGLVDAHLAAGQWHTVARNTSVVRAVELCGDLTFVAGVANAIAAIRRPFALGNCVIVSAAAPAVVLAASAHLQASLVTIATDIREDDLHVLLLEMIRAVLDCESATLLTVPVALMRKPHVIAALQALVLPVVSTPLVSPAQLLRLFKGRPLELASLLYELTPSVNIAKVRPTGGHSLHALV